MGEWIRGAPRVVLVVKNLSANAGDRRDSSAMPGSGRALGEGNDSPLQYSFLEKPVDRGAWLGYFPEGRKESDMAEVT